MSEQTVTSITVGGDRPYEVRVGYGAMDALEQAFAPGTNKVLLVHQPALGQVAEQLRDRLSATYEVLLAEIPDAEAAKRVEVAAFCWQILGQADFTRADAVVGLGGGAATDLAGFVAATWLRGVQLIQLPSTVLGLVDAAVGGKTGINTSEGKNLVGAFHAPRAVIGDFSLLETLERGELLAGFAEVAKCGFIAHPEILDLIVADVDRVTDPSTPEFHRAVSLAIQTKADIVTEDFREAGRREFLNYGHTLGHAIEYAERYQWRHGAAISIGMVYAAELARLTGKLTDDEVDLHRDVLGRLGLPLTYRLGAWPTLLAAMQRDKKARGAVLRFVVLDGIARPTILTGPEPHLLFTAYQGLGE